ncbi:MAG: T9SS type A sorting domain-containing protein, partial [Microcystis sp. LE19-251.1A]|nr:T9SS type A sorting domain-containing protein [Microcystis sp. LE19-251.1A]
KIPNAPTNTNTTASLRACGSGTFNLTASGAITGETYVWRNEAGQTVGGSGNSFNTGSLGIGVYVYSVAIRSTNGCESNRTNITVNVGANPSITSQVASITKCTGSYSINLFTEYDISTGGSGTSNWTSSNSAVSSRLNATSGVLNMTGLTVGTNIPITYRFTNPEGCQSTLNLTLNVNSGVAVPAVDDIKNCSVGPASLSVKNPDANISYNWYDAATGGTLLGTGAGFTTPSLTAPQNSSQVYRYYVSASSSSCVSNRDEVVVTVVNTDQVIAGPDVSFCDNTGQLTDLRNSASPAGGVFSGTGVTYVGVTPRFNCGGDCGLSLLPNNQNYTITYTYTNTGCVYEDVRVVTLGFSPVITVTPESSPSPLSIQKGEFVEIKHNYTDATETVWSFTNESAGAFGNPVGRTYYTEGWKSLTVTIKRAGCQGNFTANNIIYVEPGGGDIITDTEDPIAGLRESVVYPNPLNGALSINADYNYKSVGVDLTNSSGVKVSRREVDLVAGVNQLMDAPSVEILPSGIYFLKISHKGQSFVLKLVKP